jgi:hypothetical protein
VVIIIAVSVLRHGAFSRVLPFNFRFRALV